MDEINQIIQDLWKSTYNSKDIKTIKIKADPSFEGKGTNAKRVFSYRVTYMNHDEKEMEMKGRCSLGQKMIASIVIRLALADAFGVNCGILALDEPTTNLDHANIENLAKFLSDLIDIRKDNEMFQLLIITHDKKFIQLLKDYTDIYFNVYKDSNGFSKIEEKFLADLDDGS